VRVLEWKNPTVTFYRERLDKPETEPFAVIKARKIVVEAEDDGFRGNIVDFFALMGDVDHISSSSVKGQRYVLCWFDDAEDDFGRSFRKLSGVTFPSGLSFTTSDEKRTYNASFQAKYGKLS
jgi:hypothetical protein